MENFLYGVLTNTGKGFFTAEDRRNFFLRGYPADVWVVGNNPKGALWIADKNGVFKTKSEALRMYQEHCVLRDKEFATV